MYDAELHAVQEAVSTLLTTTAPQGTVIICIDNQAAMATLNFNKHNHENARRALDSIEDLCTLGWQISITWCPSHCNIRGNERADTFAKQGAGSSVPCRFVLKIARSPFSFESLHKYRERERERKKIETE